MNELTKYSLSFFMVENEEFEPPWLIPVIPTTWKVEIRGLQYEDSPSKKLARPHLNK
jgi:hypothetical protein